MSSKQRRLRDLAAVLFSDPVSVNAAVKAPNNAPFNVTAAPCDSPFFGPPYFFAPPYLQSTR